LGIALRLHKVSLIVDVVIGILRVPVFISEDLLLLQAVLTLPQLLSAVWVSRSRIRSLVFWNVELIFLGVRFHPPFLLVFEPSAWYIQIEVVVWLNGGISPEEDFPVIINTFQYRSET